MFDLVLLELKRVGLIGLGLVAGLVVAALVWWSVPAWADDVRVDANIATGLDVSTSITSDETAIVGSLACDFAAAVALLTKSNADTPTGACSHHTSV